MNPKLEEQSDDHTSQFRNLGMKVMDVEEDVEELGDFYHDLI